MKSSLKRNSFFILAIIFFIIITIFSYNRFIIKKDYIVYFEGDCDQYLDSCFIGCEDDDCNEKYYYYKLEKTAADLYSNCGEDFTDCNDAFVCLSTDKYCSIEYCDPDVEDCDMYLNEEKEKINENLLKNNN